MEKKIRRALAQWEEQEYLLLCLPFKSSDWQANFKEIFASYKSLVKIAASFQKVLLIGASKEYFKPFLGIENVYFYKACFNDTWIRDFGPIDIYEGERLLAHNFRFNAWGEKYQSHLDDALNKKLFKDFFKTPLKDVDFILEGGSIENNGKGITLSTAACIYNENRNKELSKDEIDQKLKELFNIKKLIVLENGYLRGDDTNSHIDTLARFINENTIAYSSCDDKEDEHYKGLKQMEEELKNTGFRLLGLPLPKPIFYEQKRLAATYANFIFINNALLVPVYGDIKDELILNKLAKALPDRKIIGIDARVFIRENGSLHCASQNYYKGKR